MQGDIWTVYIWLADMAPYLTHWGWVMHICVTELTIIDPDDGLWPERCQAIIWTSAWILLIGPLGTNLSEISITVQTFSFKKMHLKMPSAKWRPLCLGFNVFTVHILVSVPVRIIHRTASNVSARNTDYIHRLHKASVCYGKIHAYRKQQMSNVHMLHIL